MKYLIKTTEQLPKFWKIEYLHEYHESQEFHCYQKLNKGIEIPAKEGQIVNMYEDGSPGLWRLGRVNAPS